MPKRLKNASASVETIDRARCVGEVDGGQRTTEGGSVRTDLRFGFGLGASAGALGGLAECVLLPLAVPWRVPFTVGVDALLLGLVGVLLAALFRRADNPCATAGRVSTGLAFLVVAVALGLIANRVVLRDLHHLEPVSLMLDGLVLALAGAVAFGIGRTIRRAAGHIAWIARPIVSVVLVVTFSTGIVAPHVIVRSASAPATPDPDRPPIVVLSIDTLRPDRLGTGGSPLGTSPELDRLCRESRHFPEAVVVSPGSGASHAALMTSRYPISNGVHSNFSILDDSVTTLAERLRADGYRTGGFVTNMFLGERFGFPQGFDVYVQTGVVERLAEVSPAVLRRSLAIVHVIDHLRIGLDPNYDPSFETALAWMRESSRPTFFFVHLMDVHSPYVPRPEWGARFGAERAAPDEASNRWGWRRAEPTYLAEIRYADTKVGRLRRALQEVGWLDRAVFALTTDHGENLEDHAPHFSHGSTLFESTIRVLFAIRAPGRLDPGLDPRLVSNVDLLPSLAALTDRAPDPDWEGRSALGGAESERDVVFSQIYGDFAVRTRDEKLILYADGARSWFRLDADPGEKEPLTPVGEELARAEGEFAVWYDEYVTGLYTRSGGEISPEVLSPEALAQLKTLGYLD